MMKTYVLILSLLFSPWAFAGEEPGGDNPEKSYYQQWQECADAENLECEVESLRLAIIHRQVPADVFFAMVEYYAARTVMLAEVREFKLEISDVVYRNIRSAMVGIRDTYPSGSFTEAALLLNLIEAFVEAEECDRADNKYIRLNEIFGQADQWGDKEKFLAAEPLLLEDLEQQKNELVEALGVCRKI